MIDRFCCVSAVVFLVFVLFANAAARSQGVSLQTIATFSSKFPENRWSVPLKSTDGQTLYILSLEPDFDTRRHVITVELVLQHPGAKADSPNLLDPTGKRHGLQPYQFPSAGFVQGIDKSTFGRKRTVVLKKLGLIVEMTVLKAEVSPTTSGNAGGYQIDTLEVHITVHDSNSEERDTRTPPGRNMLR
jgi:hypothetical protein